MSEHNGLDDAQIERLNILAGELFELGVEVQKTARFGYQSTHPADPSITNKQRLEYKVACLMIAIGRIIAENEIDAIQMSRHQSEKLKTCNLFTFYQSGAIQT